MLDKRLPFLRMDFHCRVLACAWFLVSADVVAQKGERASEKRREERMREPVSIFTNTSIHPLSRLREKTVSRVKVTKVKMSKCPVEGFTRSTLTFSLPSAR